MIDLAVSEPVHLDWQSSSGSINALLEVVGAAVKKGLPPSGALVEVRNAFFRLADTGHHNSLLK